MTCIDSIDEGEFRGLGLLIVIEIDRRVGSMEISERVIEDILSSDKSIVAGMLGLQATELELLARQKVVPSGKLDMLFVYRDELILVELKAVPFYVEIIGQISNYYADLLELQNLNRLLKSPIRKIVLVTGFSEQDLSSCHANDIQLLSYDPKVVLEDYYRNFRELSYFLTLQSGDFGVVRLGLLRQTIHHIAQGEELKEIAERENRSIRTIRNRVSVAMQLNLVAKFRDKFYLTEYGEKFTAYRNSIDDRLSREQVDMLQTFVRENPFYSAMTYTILSFVESVFVLAKNRHPVPQELVREHFVTSVGKIATWSKAKSKLTASYIYANYAIELEFISRIDKGLYLAPAGINAVLLLQLHRSIKLIEQKDRQHA